MIKSLTQTFSTFSLNGGNNLESTTVPLAIFTRFADEVARIARTTEMSPTARQQLCEELEATYAVITSKQPAEGRLCR